MSSQQRTVWRKSSHSPDWDNCVELAQLWGAVGVRDSKDQNGPVLRLGSMELGALLNAAKRGVLDLS